MGRIWDFLSSSDKWRFKYRRVVSHHGEIRASMKAKFGFGDDPDHHPFSETELYKRYKTADTTDTGRQELRLAFDAIRTAIKLGRLTELRPAAECQVVTQPQRALSESRPLSAWPVGTPGKPRFEVVHPAGTPAGGRSSFWEAAETRGKPPEAFLGPAGGPVEACLRHVLVQKNDPFIRARRRTPRKSISSLGLDARRPQNSISSLDHGSRRCKNRPGSPISVRACLSDGLLRSS